MVRISSITKYVCLRTHVACTIHMERPQRICTISFFHSIPFDPVSVLKSYSSHYWQVRVKRRKEREIYMRHKFAVWDETISVWVEKDWILQQNIRFWKYFFFNELSSETTSRISLQFLFHLFRKNWISLLSFLKKILW